MRLTEHHVARHDALWLRPATRDAILAQLDAAAPDWDDLADTVRRDAALLLALLGAIPLCGQRLGTGLRAALAERLRTLGADLLRAALLRADLSPSPTSPPSDEPAAFALMVAECAHHLALEIRHPHPDEAFLAGLLGAFVTATGTARHSAALIAAAERAGLPAPVIDTLAFPPGLEEDIIAAHPLMRVIAAAHALAAPDWQRSIAIVERLTGLALTQLASLRVDVAHLATLPGMADGMLQTASLPVTATATPAPSAIQALHRAAIGAFIRTAFTDLEPEQARNRLAAAAALLSGMSPPLVVCADDEHRLVALPLHPDPTLSGLFDELAMRLDDETSLVALTARSGKPTSTDGMGASPRSACDWHLARWLGRGAIACVPLALADGAGAAVLGLEPGQALDAREMALIGELATAAARAALAHRGQRAHAERIAADVEARFRGHARKIAHETRNPLAVIKNYLAIMAQRQAGAAALGNELGILHGELDRIAALLERAGNPPPAAPESARCNVPELLNDLSAVYGESLFERRGIRFELRAATGLPAAAIPPSDLKQVLLNLFRNAAEALQPGGRFSVTVPGQVVSNGAPCLEIRLIDNGPGLPLDRVTDLFTPRPSTKGETHEGLGLAIVKETLAQWGGIILCRSQSGTGTSFQILLPLDQKT